MVECAAKLGKDASGVLVYKDKARNYCRWRLQQRAGSRHNVERHSEYSTGASRTDVLCESYSLLRTLARYEELFSSQVLLLVAGQTLGGEWKRKHLHLWNERLL
jgi:hypothetical protein